MAVFASPSLKVRRPSKHARVNMKIDHFTTLLMVMVLHWNNKKGKNADSSLLSLIYESVCRVFPPPKSPLLLPLQMPSGRASNRPKRTT